MTAFFHRCPSCHLECAVELQDYLPVSTCCDEVAEKVFLCATCGAREVHDGCEECIECVADAFVADPVNFIGTAELVREVAEELAKRVRPFLTKRQAA